MADDVFILLTELLNFQVSDEELGQRIRYLYGEADIDPPTEMDDDYASPYVRITVKDMDKMTDAELGALVRKRLKRQIENKQLSLNVYRHIAAELYGVSIEDSVPNSESESEDDDDMDVQIVDFAKKKKPEGKTVSLRNFPIFRSGKVNGKVFTNKDIDELVKNFGKKLVEPFLKLGHGDQKILKGEGLMAIGWVTKIFRKGDILYCSIRDIPAKVYNLIKKGAWKQPSIEFYTNFEDNDGKKHGKVLAALALLGSEQPAVKNLLPQGSWKDIEDLYIANNERFELMVLSTDFTEFNTEGGLNDMAEEEKTPEQIAAEKEAADKAAADKEAADKEAADKEAAEKEAADKEKEKEKETPAPDPEKDKLIQENEDLKKRMEVLEGKMKAEEDARRSVENAAFVEKLKSTGQVTPAMEGDINRLFAALEGLEVVKFTEEQDGKDVEVEKEPIAIFRALLENLPTAMVMKEVSVDADGLPVVVSKDIREAAKTRDPDAPDAEIYGADDDAAIKKLMKERNIEDYGDAMEIYEAEKGK